MPGKKSYGRFQRFNNNPKKKKKLVVVLVNPESSDVSVESEGSAPPPLSDLPSAGGTRSDCHKAVCICKIGAMFTPYQ